MSKIDFQNLSLKIIKTRNLVIYNISNRSTIHISVLNVNSRSEVLVNGRCIAHFKMLIPINSKCDFDFLKRNCVDKINDRTLKFIVSVIDAVFEKINN